MMEHAPEDKRDEQYPLLKVEAGSGDNVMRAQVPSPSVWHVACTPKQSWCSRLPEFVSACWMTAILLAISFLVFYALGMSAYRRQPVVIIRCNDSKPASDVFYHHILPRDASVPFSLFSKYLSYMAKQYPLLRFNVYFLLDDSWPNSSQVSRRLRFLKQLVPQASGSYNSIFDQNYKREIKDFQRLYQNVNISVLNLSKYMAMTPFRHKWRNIPANYLSFYARIHAIWLNGGIGFDLVTFNNLFNNNQVIEHRVDAILRQHNEGIKPEKYADTFNSFDKDDQSEFFSMVVNLFNQMLNDTCSFFGADVNTNVKVKDNTPVVRTHRSKREVITTTNNNTNSSVNIKINDTIDSNFEKLKNISETVNYPNISKEINNSYTDRRNDIELVKRREFLDLLNVPNISDFNVNRPQVLFFYDFSGLSDDIGPSYLFPKTLAPFNVASIKNSAVKHEQNKLNFLSLTPEGHFVAAPSHHHPFLAQLFSAGCQRLSPTYAIKDTLFSQCSGFLRDDAYCENIRVFYNVS